ncbi:MAG: hypothetical protein ACOYYF_00345 [Chloroflexota bacterium]|nr:hypothetical protein [Chloroflexota bacterium]MBI5703434.1 hypothetical protein [Chloroflexota bacterium]
MNAKFYKSLRISLLLAILFVNLGLDRPQAVYAAAPSHDDIANAKLIDNITYVDANVNTTEATPRGDAVPGDGSDPDNVGPCEGKYLNVGNNTVWYRYTPTVQETISVDTIGTNYDEYLAVWTGTVGNLNLVACSDDNYNGFAELSFIANPGVTYYIQAAQFNGYEGGTPSAPTGGLLQFHVYITNLDVSVGASLQNSYYLYSASVLTKDYLSLLDGPVKVTSTIGENIFTSQRVTSGDSYNELMGFPANQLTTEYWFPYYDHGYPNVIGSNMRTWILVGNASTTQSANVQIYIGGVLMEDPNSTATPKSTTFTIPPGGNVTPRWIGLQGGPVRVVSTNSVPIFTSQRVFTSTNNAFDEKLGYPANQFTTEYWFPWYDDVNMTNHILVGNTSSSQAASVQIFIAGVLRGTYTIPAKGVLQQRYIGLIGGPVQVRSTNGVNIVASQKSVSGTKKSYNEVMGYPYNQFTTTYWFPWYDHGYPNVIGSNMRTWILVGNPSTTQSAHVQIYIGGVLMEDPNSTSTPKSTTFTIPPRGNVTPRWIGLQGGPVQIVSDIPIFASERVFTVPNSVFNEAMGIPGNQLTSEYWYPWYDSKNMNNFLLISKP